MFRLVRFFFVTSAIAVAAIVAAAILFRQHETNQLVAFAESQNVALARAFANTIWPRFATFVTSASEFEKETLAVQPEIPEIREAVKLVSAGLPVLKVKIYNLDGLTVYSSNAEEIGESKSNNPGFFSAARDGLPASKLAFRNAISSFEGTVQDRDLVESYLPVRRGELCRRERELPPGRPGSRSRAWGWEPTRRRRSRECGPLARHGRRGTQARRTHRN